MASFLSFDSELLTLGNVAIALVAIYSISPAIDGVSRTVSFLSSITTSKRHGRIDKYNNLHDDGDAGLDGRNKEYGELVDSYYDLATEFYEWGWGSCFHFAVQHRNETYKQSIVRHEHYLASRLDVGPESHVLDCGCGIGGPARNIHRFTGSKITAVTLNQFQVDRGNFLCRKEGCADKVELKQADFMKLPFEDNTFDAVFAIESTCHAPDRNGVYSEIMRVLKPGGKFACYEWCLTDKYDKDNDFHRKCKKDIEVGDGLPDIVHTSVCTAALKKVGFDILDARDVVEDQRTHIKEGKTWYHPLTASWNPLDWPRFQFNPILFNLMPIILSTCELIGLVPKGTSKTQVMLQAGGVGLSGGGKEEIFTPMWLMVGRKPGKA